MKNKNHFNKFLELFPDEIGSYKVIPLIIRCFKILRKISKNRNFPFVPYKNSDLSVENFKRIEEKFGKISEKGLSPEIVIDSIIKTFLKGVPNWRSPFLQYNICSPVNIVASALACIANELNIHNISTDFAGTCLSAEIAISRIIAKLIDKDPSTIRGIFTFGGTGSNMYAFKLAFNHIDPLIYKKGLKDKIYYFITENAHFSHKTIADWLGLGFDRLIIIKADKESRSLVSDAKTKMEEIIKNGGIIAGITLNGGPFYDFAIDDIEAFVKLREWLIKKYKLQYKFRIHVDSVIGWIWLVFNGYDFERNPLKIPEDVKPLIKTQFERIYNVRLADSFGVDFHKGLGGCPIPCGMFIAMNKNDLLLLSKSKRGVDTHHLGNDWSLYDPQDITLETSRAGAYALAALGYLQVMGLNGLRQFLINQMVMTKFFRDRIDETKYYMVGNKYALGFNTMVMPLPPEFNKPLDLDMFLRLLDEDDNLLNFYNNLVSKIYKISYQSKKPYINRLGCSFSKSFKKTFTKGQSIAGLKYCFVSPHINFKVVEKEIQKLNKFYTIAIKDKN